MNNELRDAKNGNQNAFAQIAANYSPLIQSMKERFSAYGAEPEDLEQEALIALYSAVLSYEEGREVTFGLYAKVCIRNRMISYLRRTGAVRKRGQTGEDDDPGQEDVPENGADPAEKLIERERYERLMEVVDETLSDLEKKVLALYLRDWSYARIAERLGVSEKTVDNAIYRMKAKLRRRI